jgi:hypothetical protein
MNISFHVTPRSEHILANCEYNMTKPGRWPGSSLG